MNRSSAPSWRSSVEIVVVEEVVAGDDRDRRARCCVVGTQAAKETETVDERHAKVEDDGVGPGFFGVAQAGFGADGRAHLIALEPQHAGKRLRHALIVVDDEDFRRNGVETWLSAQ